MSSYHQETAYQRHSLGGHYLDFSEQPHPFKRYRHRRPLPLPSPRPPRADFFELALGRAPREDQAPRAADLAAVMLMAAGITTSTPHGQRLRAPASAGALYPAELYAVACQVEGLEDGVYHFDPQGPGLHHLWPGPHAGQAARALAAEPSRLSFIVTAYFWRSLWKYRTRAYRYCLLDAGHMLANLELACAGCGLAPRSRIDFRDSSLEVMLGLANQDEVPLVAVQAGGRPARPGPRELEIPPLDLQARPLSGRVGRDPRVLAAHARGELEEVPQGGRSWLTPKPVEGVVSLPRPQPPAADLLETVRSRRSRRNFLPARLDEEALSLLLAAALPRPGPCQATVILAGGPELEGGNYVYIPELHLLLPRQVPADPRPELARAALDQLWVGQAALLLVLWADLEALEELGGPRTYRHAMLAAGRAGQRLYLAATALGLGCCGVGAFYDEELAQAARLPGRAQPLYLLACGPVKGWPGR